MKRLWEPDVNVSSDLAKSLVEEQFPQLAPVAIAKIGQGWDNVAYEVNSAYVFRFPQREIAVELIEREIRALPIIAKHVSTTISVPCFVGKPSDEYPCPFAGYAKISGTTGCSLDIPKDAQSGLARQLGEFLQELHSIDASVARDLQLKPDPVGRFDHARQLPRAVENFSKLEAAGLVESPERFFHILEQISATEEVESPVIVHGDLSSGHIIIGERYQLVGVIDWGDIHLGNPALDLTIAYAFFSTEKRQELLRAYGPVSNRTWELARYRAICAAAITAEYAYSVTDQDLLYDSLRKLKNCETP